MKVSITLGQPVPLHEADLTKSFVYDRRWGVFYVPFGHHQLAMATLLAFHHGYTKALVAAKELGLKGSAEAADRWLEATPGAAFRSSVGKNVQVGPKGNLTPIELRWLGDVTHVF